MLSSRSLNSHLSCFGQRFVADPSTKQAFNTSKIWLLRPSLCCVHWRIRCSEIPDHGLIDP
jgi:hypothetical protein